MVYIIRLYLAYIHPGDRCWTSEDCKSNLCDQHQHPPKCYELYDDGHSCEFDHDCYSGYCNNNKHKCTSLGSEGDHCDKNKECLSKYCHWNTCMTRKDVSQVIVYTSLFCFFSFCSNSSLFLLIYIIITIFLFL